MADLVIEHITHYFEQDRVILDDVSFQIDPGERVGLLGVNGAGKTTLLRIITGELTCVSGRVITSRGKRVGYVPQLPSYPEGATGEDVMRLAFARAKEIENELHALSGRISADSSDEDMRRLSSLTAAFEAAGGYEFDVRLNKAANGLGIDAGMRARPYAQLSGGEQMRVNLAKLILEDADIMVLDEPTNHLDMNGMLWLEEYLKSYKGAVLAVSHDRYFLDRIAKRIIELTRFGMAAFYSGNYSFYVVEKEARYQLKLKQFEIEQAKIKQLEETARRLHTWAQAYDNKFLHKRAFAIEKRIEWLRQTDRPLKDPRLNAAFAGERFFAAEAIRVTNLSKSFGDNTLFGDFSALVRGGERIALMGDNGSGKTTLLKILMGMESPDSGKCALGPSAKLVYIPQKIAFDRAERTLVDTLLYELNLEPQAARDRLGLFMFSGENALKTVSQLSGGERMRLKMCLAMNARVNMLVLDEPTNHLDIPSREWIEQAIEAFEGVLVFVSHDRYFIRRFATRIWEIEGGRVRDYACGFDKYLSIREKERAQAKVLRAPPAEKTARPPARAERKREAIEREIERKDAQLAELDELAQANASDYIALGDIERDKLKLEAERDRLYEEWAEYAEA